MTNDRQLITTDKAPAVPDLSRPGLPVKLTKAGLDAIEYNMKAAEVLVARVLEPNIDYGRTPGTPAPSLWDPGASKIINAFNCYPEYKILRKVDEKSEITTMIEVKLISRDTGLVVGSGIGSASTRETKHGKRWVEDPIAAGYTPDLVGGLKTKEDAGKTLYRIDNPDIGELGNTIDKMAAKRADVDAAESLPGVKSALRRLFDPKAPKKATSTPGPDWKSFWSKVRQMGLEGQEVHKLLGVKSMEEWLAAGRSLEEALQEIPEAIARAQSEATL